ncbi:MAG: hypothetical protein ACLFSE_06675 [Spirochaetia bacterium]
MNIKYAGFAKREITPEPGTFGSLRLSPAKRSTGIHDPIFIRALSLRENKTRLLIISADSVFSRIEENLGIPCTAEPFNLKSVSDRIFISWTDSRPDTAGLPSREEIRPGSPRFYSMWTTSVQNFLLFFSQ